MAAILERSRMSTCVWPGHFFIILIPSLLHPPLPLSLVASVDLEPNKHQHQKQFQYLQGRQYQLHPASPLAQPLSPLRERGMSPKRKRGRRRRRVSSPLLRVSSSPRPSRATSHPSWRRCSPAASRPSACRRRRRCPHGRWNTFLTCPIRLSTCSRMTSRRRRRRRKRKRRRL